MSDLAQRTAGIDPNSTTIDSRKIGWNNPGKWLGMDGTYKDLNSTLNGLPEIVKNIPAPETPATPPDYDFGKAALSSIPEGIARKIFGDDKVNAAKAWRAQNDAAVQQTYNKAVANPVYGNIMSGTEGALSGATMGLPEALASKISPQSYQQIQDLKAKYGTANTVGNIAGGVASSFALPGVGSALAAKGGFMAGKALLPTLARAGLNAASFAVPSAINQTIATGDTGQAAKDLGVNMFVGTVGGAALEKILKGAGNIVGKFKRGVQNTSLAGDLDINGRVIKSVVNGANGDPIERAQNLKDQIIDLANVTRGTDSDIATEAGKLKTVRTMQNNWDTIVDKTFQDFKANGGKLADYKQQIMSDPRVQDILSLHPELEAKFNNTIDMVSNRADTQGIAPVRKLIREKIIEAGERNGASDESYLTAELGRVIHDITDAQFVPPELKSTYARDLTLKDMLIKEEYHIPKPAQAGSQTAARLLSSAILTGAGGAALGPAGLAVGLGGMANSALASGINKGLGKMATSIYPHLANITGKGLMQAAGPVGDVAAKLGGSGVIQNSVEQANAPIEGGAPLSSMTYGQQPSPAQTPTIPPGAQPIPNAPAGPAPMQQAIAPVAPQGQTPQAPPAPSPQEQAQAQFNQTAQPQKIGKWDAQTVDSRLQTMYSRFVRQYGQVISPDQFKQDVLQATDNLNPMNPGTWKGMYDDPATAEKMYKDYMSLQKMPLDLTTNFFSDALNHYLGGIRLDPLNMNEDMKRQDRANVTLVQTLMDITKMDKKTVEEKLRSIAFDHGLKENPAKNQHDKSQAIINMIVQQGGIDWNTFQKMGLL
jgi:hypothetical protein